jgi:hypothetical protein
MKTPGGGSYLFPVFNLGARWGSLSTLRLGCFSLGKAGRLDGPQRRFSKNPRIQNFTKIRPVRAALFYADIQREARADVTKLIDAVFKMHFQVLSCINTLRFRFLYQLLLPCAALTDLFKPTWGVFTARYEMDHYMWNIRLQFILADLNIKGVS